MAGSVFVVLAGGRGERLWPVSETRAKPLVPILGEPLVCRHLRLGLATGLFDEAVVLVGYRGGEVVEAVRACGFGGVRFVEQGGALGTGHAVRRVLEELGGEGVFTFVYGDVYLDSRFYGLLASAEAPSVLAGWVEDARWYGLLDVGDGLVRGVVEKPREPRGGWVFLGGFKVDGSFLGLLRGLEPSPRGEVEVTDALEALAREGVLRALVGGEGWGWVDVGRPWDVLRANRMAFHDPQFSGGVEGEVHSSAVLEGDVERIYIARGARIGAHSVVEGPAYIGPGARVGPGAHVRGYTVLLEGAYVGFASEVKASVIMEGARAPHLNYVGDSVVGEHVNLGAGTVTANLRFDGRSVRMTVKGERVDTGLRKLGAVIGGYAQTGINVSIMPGVRIGPRALVYPGCVVGRDVGSGEAFKC
ncbi:putative nucleotidyl transferase [Aeropyrum pernix K1]|uniref:Nucleotidyl transferase n=1 Tax=Aeropyrum pernix (strain ATCC 700893 / DSM 11879 / JCM 9820 / NBRC 100138 / K1) TaxID=272557 RepID=Q9YCQ9_AERPE|nr:bifunctional sugar-1-phosphate nucleotidylyltransferase/acetyltransferase [Aeropyrum pernix]BAA80188.2 putative nucleotidyl transferase [Aeropyrum pernix K1]